MSIIEIAQKTRVSARKLAVLSADAKNQAIEAVAKALEAAAPDIVAANAADCKAACADGIAKPLYDRLKLDESKLKSAIAGVRDVAIQKMGWKNTTKARKAFGDVPVVTTETRFVRWKLRRWIELVRLNKRFSIAKMSKPVARFARGKS